MAVATLAACEDPTVPPIGALAITTTAPTIEQPFTTKDGWLVTYSKFVVSFGTIVVAGTDGVVTAENDAFTIDQTTAPPKSLLAAQNRIARAWQDVHFTVAPVDPAPALSIVGTMTKAGATKKLAWDFTTATSYTACTGGMNVPVNGTDTANVVMSGDVFFASGGDDVAKLDADSDGTITLAELGAAGPDAAAKIVVSFRDTGTCVAAPVTP